MAMNTIRQALVDAGLATKKDAMKIEDLKRQLENAERSMKKYKNKDKRRFKMAKGSVKRIKKELKLEDKS